MIVGDNVTVGHNAVLHGCTINNNCIIGMGSVILNRIQSKQFPDTIRDVILQKGQFSSLMDGQANYYPGEEELQAARAALLGYDPTLGSIYFYNPDIATNTAWISRRNFVKRIGGHVFLR